ncbi:hypothetical protein S40288_04377 [Stachybotrys chartarum IBT 40288]|nr:hypothetical protein S40288_04377 [Stachybotrys chartarum IBT 40288]
MDSSTAANDPRAPGRKTRTVRSGEKRRESNRRAQQAFRDRQKARREAEVAAVPKPRVLRPRPATERPLMVPRADSPPAPASTREPVSDTSPTPTANPCPCPLGQAQEQAQAQALALADPLANAKRLLPTTIFSAVLHNALALRLGLDYISSCHGACISPFFRAGTPGDSPSALLASVHATLGPHLPASLRPSLTQVLVPHHVSLDLIPLPAFRDQAIVLSAALPDAFNPWELKEDIYARGGLACLEAGVPWDKGCWVAEPWFLRKWSLLVDADKDGLCRSEAVTRALASAWTSSLPPRADGVGHFTDDGFT